MRHAEPAPWGFGGDCHITVDADDVLVENDFTGDLATLDSSEFLTILDDYAGVLAKARGITSS